MADQAPKSNRFGMQELKLTNARSSNGRLSSASLILKTTKSAFVNPGAQIQSLTAHKNQSFSALGPQ